MLFKLKFRFMFALLFLSKICLATQNQYITTTKKSNNFPLFTSQHATPIFINSQDFFGVYKAAKNLQNDIMHITGVKPKIYKDNISNLEKVVIIGTIDKSLIINKLIKLNKIDVHQLRGKTQKFIIKTIKNPLPGIEEALVIVGSDKLGSIYGIYDLSNEIGVSPWVKWSGAKLDKKTNLFIEPGTYTKGEPSIKYRGLVLNEDSSIIKTWLSKNKSLNSEIFYDDIFELILRLRGNYLNSNASKKIVFNKELAEEYGITIEKSIENNGLEFYDQYKLNENKILSPFQIENIYGYFNSLNLKTNNGIAAINSSNYNADQLTIDFFLNQAWGLSGIYSFYNLENYYKKWIKTTFSGKFSNDIINVLKKYYLYNSQLSIKNQKPHSYSLTNYNEAKNVLAQYKNLVNEVNQIYNSLSEDYKKIYYRNILYPILVRANLNEININKAQNKYYAKQGRSYTNTITKNIRKLYNKNIELTKEYNIQLDKDKLHNNISLDVFKIPETKTINIPAKSSMGISIENSDEWWPNSKKETVLPTFDIYNKQTYNLEIFNRGSRPFKYKIKSKVNWLKFTTIEGTIKDQEKVSVSIDWEKAPLEVNTSSFIIQGANEKVKVNVIIKNPENLRPYEVDGYIESNGYISIAPNNYSKAFSNSSSEWITIPNYGLSKTAIRSSKSTYTNNNEFININNEARLEYDIYFSSTGLIKIHVLISNLPKKVNQKGQRFALSFDNDEHKVINISNKVLTNQTSNIFPSNNVKVITIDYYIKKAGKHKLNLYMIEEGIIFEKIVLVKEKLKSSFFGPPESFNRVNKTFIKMPN